MSKPLVIGIIGFGNIGSGVVRTLQEQAREIESRLPRPIRIKTIVDQDLDTPRPVTFDPARMKADASAILQDPEIDVVVELIGGEEPARTFVEHAIHNGKHVVTANKALLAVHGGELIRLAHERGVALLFEAAVAGGIPIIRTLEQGLSANRIDVIQGIFNGTCNYILTEMADRGITFATALQEAQQKGYAEPDPTYDIEGYDTAHKTAILASLGFGMDIRFEHVHVEGITQVQALDIRYAKELGYTIKLLGIAKQQPAEGWVEVRVHPTLVRADSPMSKVDGVYNAVLVEGEPIGSTMYQGQGAGARPTSSAVVSDLMAIAADHRGYNPWRDQRLGIRVDERSIKPMSELRTHYYIRFTVNDQPGVMATIGRALADHNVSIESMIQHQPEGGIAGQTTLSIVTHLASEAGVQGAIAEVARDEVSVEPAFLLRVEE